MCLSTGGFAKDVTEQLFFLSKFGGLRNLPIKSFYPIYFVLKHVHICCKSIAVMVIVCLTIACLQKKKKKPGCLYSMKNSARQREGGGTSTQAIGPSCHTHFGSCNSHSSIMCR